MQAEELVLRIHKGYKPTAKERWFLSEVLQLKLVGLPISSLEGLSDLTNLKILILNSTLVSSLEGLNGLINLQTIDLSDTRVSSLKGLNSLTNLQTIDLSGTRVSSLEGLSGLTNLRRLDLRHCKINSLEGLSGLTNLQEIDLSGTQINSLEGLSELTNLQEIDLSGTQINSLEGLSRLTNLQKVDLSSTRISSLEGLNGLTKLEELWLNNTQIISLKELSNLTNLRLLDLTGTSVSSLKGLIGSTNLNQLYISGTSLDSIPEWLVEKKLPFRTNEYWGWKPGVYMQDVKLSEQDVDIFFKSRRFIEAWYRTQGLKLPINEAKVIFLGDGGVGKTYSIYRINHSGKKPSQDDIKTTPGVSITQYRCNNEIKTTVNFWDFGGQEIMHSMHRCFLTERTCYVVTVSNRYSEVTRQARRWLKNIESFAPKSEIILAVNQWEGVKDHDLDERRLRREFPNLVDVVKYTATDVKDIEQLRELIEKYVAQLPSVTEKFPKSWLEIMQTVRNELDQTRSQRFLISKSDFHQICQSKKYEQKEYYVELLTWYNELGVCFSYHQDRNDSSELANYVILNPQWLTNAVYIIVNNGEEFAHEGRINRQGMLKILNNPAPDKSVLTDLKYKENELEYILEVMREFRLSFDVGENQEFVPALCPNETPDPLPPSKFVQHIRCEVRYDYLPESVSHRLMVYCFKELHLKLDYPKCWFKGLCIDESALAGLYAVCDMGKDDDVLYIDVYQLEGAKDSKPQSPQSLLRKLLNKIKQINDELNLKSTTWICSVDSKAAFKLSFLLNAFKKGERYVSNPNDDEFINYDVQELLGQVLDDPPQIERLLLHREDREQIKDELTKNDEFLSSIVEKLVEKTGNIFNGPVQINQPQGNLDITAPVVDVKGDYIAGNSNDSASGLAEQLEEFRNTLLKLEKLNEDQKDLLFDAIGELIDHLNDSEEVQVKWKGKFQKALKSLGATLGTTVQGVTTELIAEYLKGYLPF